MNKTGFLHKISNQQYGDVLEIIFNVNNGDTSAIQQKLVKITADAIGEMISAPPKDALISQMSMTKFQELYEEIMEEIQAKPSVKTELQSLSPRTFTRLVQENFEDSSRKEEPPTRNSLYSDIT